MENRLRKKQMKRILIGIVVITCLILGILTVLFKVFPKSSSQTTIASRQYDATDLMKKAMDNLKNQDNKSEIISDVQTANKVIALSFKGLSNPETNQTIINLVSEYKEKGTFFLPGILAAEDSETIQLIKSNGQRIGSNSLSGLTHMEEYSSEELVTDFCRTNDILNRLTGTFPNLILCNSTNYSDKILQATYASGNTQVVNSTHNISYQSFTNYSQVLDYIKGLSYGSIITIKLDGVLDEAEYEPQVKEDKPAVDKQPDTNADETVDDEITDEEKLIQIVEWILQAIKETEYKTVFVEDIPSYSDSDYAMDFTDLREENKGNLATVLTNISTTKNLISFTFRGIENKENLDEVLQFLKDNNYKATFFVTGSDIINYADRIKDIINSGNQIGNGGMTGDDLTNMDFNKISFEIYKCDKLLQEKLGVKTDIFMPVFGKYNDVIREAASTLDYKIVTYSKNPITEQSASIENILNYYKNGFKKGDVIFFRLDFYKDLDKAINQTVKLMKNDYTICSVKALIANHSVDTVTTAYVPIKSTGSKPTNVSIITNNTTPEEDAIEENKQREEEIKELRAKNNGKLAKEISTVYTTEQALSFTFSGIYNTPVLNDVLEKLDALHAKGTFFVTEQELIDNQDSIEKIAKAGHEIEICLNGTKDLDFNSVCADILSIQEKIEALTGKKATLVRYPYVVNMTDEMLEAVSSTGCEVVWQDLSFASSKVGKQGTFDDVYKYAYNEGNISAKRGYIVFFRMDFYDDPKLIGQLMLNYTDERVNAIAFKDNIAENGSGYQIESLKSLMNKDYNYTYPVTENKILASIKDKIYEGHLAQFSDSDIFDYLQQHYVGNPDVSSLTTLPGFSETELDLLNKAGTFTDDKVLFLTFDDWGSDKPINQILYVLKKYNIKASFFIRTNNVQTNPNLLRAIAEGGHDVGSHTDEHLPFANSETMTDENDVSSVYTSLSEEEVEERTVDLMTSYNKLESIIGDVEIDGNKALTRIFRPPTLAMSKIGMKSIFDMGFTHIVSGDFNTGDYEAASAEELSNTILKGILRDDGTYTQLQNGSVLVLHMLDDTDSPNSKNDITAEALDIVIPKLLEEGYHFARLSQYLSDDE